MNLIGQATLKATAGFAANLFSSHSTDHNIIVAQSTYARVHANKTTTHEDKVNIRSVNPDHEQTIVLPNAV